MRIVLVLSLVGLLAGLAWGNGEAIRYDPQTGIILPAEGSPAQVERESLEIEFQPREKTEPTSIHVVKVRARYRLRNPTEKPLNLQIGFPVPGGAMQLAEPPVRLDEKLGEWRLLDYRELLEPLRPKLIRAMERWADRHPRAVKLARQISELDRQRVPYDEKNRRMEALWHQLRAELVRARVSALRRNVWQWLYPSHESQRVYRNVWDLRNALRVTGQRSLLPEARWQVDQMRLDPATGRQVWSPEDMGTVSMLIFPVRLEPKGRHLLEVVYRQSPSREEGEAVYHLEYILRTVRSWASFGPIETTIKAPTGLIFRSRPSLRLVGSSDGLNVYRGVLLRPSHNLQVVLVTSEGLLPRLKVNGIVHGRLGMVVGRVPLCPLTTISERGDQTRIRKRMEQGEVVLSRKDITLRGRPGEQQVQVDGETLILSTPVVVRKGRSYLPLEALQALFPEYEVNLSYHAPSHTVLLGVKPKS